MPGEKRQRLRMESWEGPIYAIGDIHGRHDLLLRAEEAIFADGAGIAEEKLIVTLGDYIDRGPASAQVLEHLLQPVPQGYSRICLTGNHEIMMLDYIEGRLGFQAWLKMGGDATLASYGLDAEHLPLVFPRADQLDSFIQQSLPGGHIDFLRAMPILLDTPDTLFVHAGIDPGAPIDEQSDEDLVFIRHRFLESRMPLPKLVVHGHTPRHEPDIAERRLNLDTRAFKSGRLTVARLWRGRVHLFTT